MIDEEAFWNSEKAHIAVSLKHCTTVLNCGCFTLPLSFNASKGKRNRQQWRNGGVPSAEAHRLCLSCKVWDIFYHIWPNVPQIKVGQEKKESPLLRESSWATPSVWAPHLCMSLYLFQHDCEQTRISPNSCSRWGSGEKSHNLFNHPSAWIVSSGCQHYSLIIQEQNKES